MVNRPVVSGMSRTAFVQFAVVPVTVVPVYIGQVSPRYASM